MNKKRFLAAPSRFDTVPTALQFGMPTCLIITPTCYSIFLQTHILSNSILDGAVSQRCRPRRTTNSFSIKFESYGRRNVINVTLSCRLTETAVTTPNVITYTKCNTNHKCNKKSTPNVIPTTNVIKNLHQM